MYLPKTLIYFTPFYFENGNNPQNKYFIVLEATEQDIVLASLPTSKNQVPNHIQKTHGCLNHDESRFNCYLFEKQKIISECNTFSFPLDTFVYGEQVFTTEKTKLENGYKSENKDFVVLCKLSETEYRSLINCLKNSKSVKNRIKRLIA